jgi:hypothetical protein
MSKYLYDRFEFSKEYKEELVEMIKHQTNIEIGGYKVFDGSRTHLLQSPYELPDLIFALKKHEKDCGKKIKRFLEVGFASGINNTIFNKFFDFDEVVGVDIFEKDLNGDNFLTNLKHKNLTLVCGDSTSKRVLNIVDKFGLFDFIFIDANHTYEYVKKDFENYIKMLDKHGVIGFHDIDNPDWPGINKFWNELKETKKYKQVEFLSKDYFLQYGIGMLTLKR